jgi:hypothetical protein
MCRLLLSTCAFGLFAIFGTANAGSPAVLPGTSYAVPVEQAGNLGRPDLGSAVLGYGDRVDGDLSYDDGPASFLHEPQTAGADEMGEPQSMFPSSARPPSMRY